MPYSVNTNVTFHLVAWSLIRLPGRHSFLWPHTINGGAAVNVCFHAGSHQTLYLSCFHGRGRFCCVSLHIRATPKKKNCFQIWFEMKSRIVRRAAIRRRFHESELFFTCRNL
ncbi:hypothetical protein CEXT_730481 [Caerostris extrusa]|uniref:Secreted protein n=1 Tax=Caerostris extrusa TaxID=172846 RepID=A0AAV4ND82_CAEEX|nr:hypothetical protein CEXT_730481 [Caerostris extrusa]